MKSKIVIDKKRRQLLCKKEQKIRLWKSLSVNEYLSSHVRSMGRFELSKIGMNSSKINNYCIVTGRSRGVLRDFKVSRMIFKELANSGFIQGVKKGSW